MQTHKITLSYPSSWLTVNVTINNRDTNATLETWVAIENGTTATYDYDFSGADNVDYIYIASVSGYNDIKGAVFYEAASGGWGWASVADIWSAQIGDYSGSAGSFANKFEQYGGVSHVIDRSSLDEESKKEIKSIIDKLAEVDTTLKVAPKIETKYIESTREIVRIEKVPIPQQDNKALANIIIKWLKELSKTLSTIMVKGLIEIKNKK